MRTSPDNKHWPIPSKNLWDIGVQKAMKNRGKWENRLIFRGHLGRIPRIAKIIIPLLDQKYKSLFHIGLQVLWVDIINVVRHKMKKADSRNSKTYKTLAHVLALITEVSAYLVLVIIFIFSLCTGYIGKLFVLSGIGPLVRIGTYLTRRSIEAMRKLPEIVRDLYALNLIILIAVSNKRES